MKPIIAIIGGGAAGLCAAVAACRQGAQVTVYERAQRVGRKLLATGNGRCNLSNRQASVKHYHGGAPKFVQPALERFGVGDTLQFFYSLGIMSVEENDGKLYPRALQAAAVLDGLRLKAERLGAQIITDCEITAIKPTKGGFTLLSSGGQYYAQRVIAACGGAASAPLGGTDSGYKLLEALGHKRTAIRPAIVQLKTDTLPIKGLNGIKTDTLATLYHNGRPIDERFGEILFTDYGLSGPPILYLSSQAVRLLAQGTVAIHLDLFGEMAQHSLYKLLKARAKTLGDAPLEDFCTGMLHKRLGLALLRNSQIAPLSRLSSTLTENELQRLAANLKDWAITVKDTNGLGQAQVTAGGVATADFDPATLESRLVPNLYACGELLDIDGDCGGYNLQWAWSSARLAAENAAREM